MVRHRRRWLAERRPWLIGSLVLVVVAATAAIAVITAPDPQHRAEVETPPTVPTDTPGPGLASPSPSGAAPARPSAGPTSDASASRSPAAKAKPGPRTLSGWPNASNTGVPPGVKLHTCATTISRSGTYDSCQFNGDVDIRVSDVKITRSMIKGAVDAGSGRSGEQKGLVISDTTIDCGCLADETHTPAAIMESNYTLLRVDLLNAGHGAAVKKNVIIQDTYIHGLGANTQAHKDGIYSGDGSHVVIRHNNIECEANGCTSAIGLLTDFGSISDYTIDHNLLNTTGSYCFYGSGGPQKDYTTNHIVFTNNHFGRAINAKCGFYGPVTYFDVNAPGMVWSGNVWADTGAPVNPEY